MVQVWIGLRVSFNGLDELILGLVPFKSLPFVVLQIIAAYFGSNATYGLVRVNLPTRDKTILILCWGNMDHESKSDLIFNSSLLCGHHFMIPFFGPNFCSPLMVFFGRESLEEIGFRGGCDHKRPILGVLCEPWSAATHNEMSPISPKFFFPSPSNLSWHHHCPNKRVSSRKRETQVRLLGVSQLQKASSPLHEGHKAHSLSLVPILLGGLIFLFALKVNTEVYDIRVIVFPHRVLLHLDLYPSK